MSVIRIDVSTLSSSIYLTSRWPIRHCSPNRIPFTYIIFIHKYFHMIIIYLFTSIQLNIQLTRQLHYNLIKPLKAVFQPCIYPNHQSNHPMTTHPTINQINKQLYLTSIWPLKAALQIGLLPVSLTLLGSAPLFSRYWTTCRCPWHDAIRIYKLIYLMRW